jgi:tetratricopeptide (TPR) repeat protein
MNGLIKHQSVLKEAAGAPQTLDASRFLSMPGILESLAPTDWAGPSQDSAAYPEGVAAQERAVAPSAAAGLAEQMARSSDTLISPPAAVTPPEKGAEPVRSSPLEASTLLPVAVVEPAAGSSQEANADSMCAESAAPVPEEATRIEIVDAEPQSVPETVRTGSFAWFHLLSYRSVAAVLSILLLAAAFYILLEKGAAESLSGGWPIGVRDAQTPNSTPVRQPASQTAGSAVKAPANRKAAVLLQEARALAGENRLEESKVLLRRVLEIDPAGEEAAAALKEAEQASATGSGSAVDPALERRLTSVSMMIQSGKLQRAKSEIDKLRRLYPDSPEVNALRRRWQARSAKEAEALARREEEQKAAQKLRQKEEEWDRKVSEFVAQGKYAEAEGVLNLWLAEDPQNSRALELDARVREIEKHLQTYASALSENRYQDALNALAAVERLNPADSGLAELRRQAEAKKAAAKATLTIYRLGAKGTLLLDGKPVGSDGEVSGESVAIGNHTLTIEEAGSPVMIRNQEFAENQRVVLAYDLSRLSLRPMTEADREMLAQRRAKEAVHRFTAEHNHGIFRGSCRGELSISFSDVIYKSSGGEHGFRMPFHLLNIKGSGRSVDLVFASDSEHYQSFRFQDAQAADKFRQTWNELKALGR